MHAVQMENDVGHVQISSHGKCVPPAIRDKDSAGLLVGSVWGKQLSKPSRDIIHEIIQP